MRDAYGSYFRQVGELCLGQAKLWCLQVAITIEAQLAPKRWSTIHLPTLGRGPREPYCSARGKLWSAHVARWRNSLVRRPAPRRPLGSLWPPSARLGAQGGSVRNQRASGRPSSRATRRRLEDIPAVTMPGRLKSSLVPSSAAQVPLLALAGPESCGGACAPSSVLVVPLWRTSEGIGDSQHYLPRRWRAPVPGPRHRDISCQTRTLPPRIPPRSPDEVPSPEPPALCQSRSGARCLASAAWPDFRESRSCPPPMIPCMKPAGRVKSPRDPSL